MNRSLAILLFLAFPLSAQITGAHLVSDGGDPVGEGRTYDYNATDQVVCNWWNLAAPPVPFYANCSIGPANADPARPRAHLMFTHPSQKERMARGVYEDTWPVPHNFFQIWPHAGLHVKLEDGFSVLQATGRFAILDYEVQNGNQARFSAYFEQHYANQRPALRGFFYWNYAPKVTVSLASSSVTGGQKTRVRLTLTNPAPVGGATVALRSSNALASLARNEVTIAEGGTFADVDVQTSVARWTDDVLIYAEYAGVGAVVPLTVISPFTARTEIEVNGVRHTSPESGALFEAMTVSSPSPHEPFGIRVYDRGAGWTWYLDLDSSSTGKALRPGTYETARLSLTGADNVDLCANTQPRFTILDASYYETFLVAVLRSLAVEFQCGDVSGHAYWNYVPADAEPEPPPPPPPASTRRRATRH